MVLTFILTPFEPERWQSKSDNLIYEPIVSIDAGGRYDYGPFSWPCLENVRDVKIKCKINETTGKTFDFYIFDSTESYLDWWFSETPYTTPKVEKYGIRSWSFTIHATEYSYGDYHFGVENPHTYGIVTEFTATLEWAEENNIAIVIQRIVGIIAGGSMIGILIGFLLVVIAPIAKYIFKLEEANS